MLSCPSINTFCFSIGCFARERTFIEETLPTKTIYINEAKGEESQLEPFTGINPSIITDMMRTMYDNQIKTGKTSEQAKAYLKTVEPFNLFEDLIENL